MSTHPEHHEAAAIFPLDEGTLPALAEDIRQHGQWITIKLYQGKVLDGRRRLRACRLAGVEPKFEDVSPPDPIAYAWSLNGPQRHLTPAQLAMAGARMRKLYDQQAKERQKDHGGTAPGKKKTLPANLPEVNNGQARDQVGQLVGVSGKSIDHATTVLKYAVPEVIQAVDEGRLAVSAAAALASEPEDVQRTEAAMAKRNRRRGTNSEGSAGDESPPPQERPSDPDSNPADRKVLGKGVFLAHEAINILTRIPADDGLRKQGLKLVMNWIIRNQ